MKDAVWLKPALIGVTALIVGLVAGVWFSPTEPPRPYSNMGGDFTLSSVSGPVSLSDFEDKAVLVFFGYTHCPDVCPTELVRMGHVLNNLTASEREQVRSLFVSIDPARDTLQRITEYVNFFHPSIIGLTGTNEQIHQVAQQYFVLYQKSEDSASDSGYLMDHSIKTYLVGRDGRLAAVLDRELDVSEVLEAVRRVL